MNKYFRITAINNDGVEVFCAEYKALYEAAMDFFGMSNDPEWHGIETPCNLGIAVVVEDTDTSELCICLEDHNLEPSEE